MENKDMQSRGQSPGQPARGEGFHYPRLEDVADKGDIIRQTENPYTSDETAKVLEERKRELKSLEEFSTGNVHVARLIHNRVVELGQEIRSLEAMIKSRQD